MFFTVHQFIFACLPLLRKEIILQAALGLCLNEQDVQR
jgi:hypothetical protein